MSSGRKIQNGLAVFVLLFLCLNVGGALCLTMCVDLLGASHDVVSDDSGLSEHCKLAKKAAEELEANSTRIEAGEASCCMMPVSLFAAPVEKRAEFSKVAPAALPAAVRHEFSAPAAISLAGTTVPVYRPPPLDERSQRILHSVFRI